SVLPNICYFLSPSPFLPAQKEPAVPAKGIPPVRSRVPYDFFSLSPALFPLIFQTYFHLPSKCNFAPDPVIRRSSRYLPQGTENPGRYLHIPSQYEYSLQ